eukprot:1922042-Rhodomonas_salina.1
MDARRWVVELLRLIKHICCKFGEEGFELGQGGRFQVGRSHASGNGVPSVVYGEQVDQALVDLSRELNLTLVTFGHETGQTVVSVGVEDEALELLSREEIVRNLASDIVDDAVNQVLHPRAILQCDLPETDCFVVAVDNAVAKKRQAQENVVMEVVGSQECTFSAVLPIGPVTASVRRVGMRGPPSPLRMVSRVLCVAAPSRAATSVLMIISASEPGSTRARRFRSVFSFRVSVAVTSIKDLLEAED